jgi:hypothetical protein
VILVAGLLAGGYYLAPRFEREAPLISLTPDPEVLGRAPIEIGITDRGTGLKSVTATLSAGDVREMPLGYVLKNVRYRKSTIAISDRFIQRTVAPLLNDKDAREGGAKEIFLAVNNRLRKENDDRIAEITKKVTPSILWKGAFVQLSNSKVEANFPPVPGAVTSCRSLPGRRSSSSSRSR